MRLWTLAAITSFAVLGCCGSLLVLVVTVLLMVLSPLPLLFMPCAACTYMPNASWRRRGGKAQGEGYLPPGAKRRAKRSEGLHKRSAEDCWETPCAAPGQSPQPRFGFLIRARQRT